MIYKHFYIKKVICIPDSKSIIQSGISEQTSDSEFNFIDLKKFYSENDIVINNSYKLNDKFIGRETE